jgi:predicted secreted hydrolase
MDEQAQGWDWVGINLLDGGAVMAFRMRDARGGKHWAAATWRDAESRSFRPEEVEWQPLRQWRSPRTDIDYPIEWRLRIGDRDITLQPLMDDQENDARRSTGTIYWEGAVLALDEHGEVIGRGYLELTGYGARVRF